MLGSLVLRRGGWAGAGGRLHNRFKGGRLPEVCVRVSILRPASSGVLWGGCGGDNWAAAGGQWPLASQQGDIPSFLVGVQNCTPLDTPLKM